MNTNIDNINEFLSKTFNSLTTKKETFNIKSNYTENKLTISFLENNYILFTCISNSEIYGASIYKKDICTSYKNINKNKISNDEIISLIKSNIISIKEFKNLNVKLVCLSEINTGDTIFEFFLNKLNEKTINNDVIKMLFKKKVDKQDDEYNKIINLNTNTLEIFNKTYGLNLKGYEHTIDLTFNKTSNKSSPLLKISNKGFLLFCKSNTNNLEKLILNNNDINELNILKNLDVKNLKYLDLSENNIFDISPLSELYFQKLEKLILSKNQIQDISCLKNILIV